MSIRRTIPIVTFVAGAPSINPPHRTLLRVSERDCPPISTKHSEAIPIPRLAESLLLPFLAPRATCATEEKVGSTYVKPMTLGE